MPHSPHTPAPPIGLGLASIVLGTVGLLLFFLPILGIPLGLSGTLVGIAGIIASRLRRVDELRWSCGGLIVSFAALVVGVVLYNAPLGEELRDSAPRLWQVPAGRRYIPPPARLETILVGQVSNLSASQLSTPLSPNTAIHSTFPPGEAGREGAPTGIRPHP